jgi:hypothetical protein
MSQEVTAGGVTVTLLDAGLAGAVGGVLADAVADGTGARLAEGDATLWGPEAQPEAAVRLGWLEATGVSRPLLPRLRQLINEMAGEGLYHVVLSGMGGSSLAPEVITRSAGVGLTVLDTTDPAQVRRALGDRLGGTLVVVSSKSGGTIETDSHRRIYEQAFRDLGLTDAQIAQRFVVVTDPGSPLEKTAAEAGYRAVFLADETVGGRYSALTAFGLVPSALAGVDVEQLLDDADGVRSALANSVDNPGLLLGAAMGSAALEGRNKLVVLEADRGLVGFGDWAEQLIAESTGKEGTGVLPVVVEDSDSPGWATAGSDAVNAGVGDPPGSALTVTGPLGAQFLVWEYATAYAGKVLGINPFDQPNVTESKENTATWLEKAGPEGLPIPAPVLTFGWGPRFLHSTGQFHKGGPQNGVFLQLTGAVSDDLAVPGRPWSLGTLQLAQALGDLDALAGRGRPALRLHLTDRRAGLDQVLAAVQR